MPDQVLQPFGVVPDYDSSTTKGKQKLFGITTNILIRIKAVLEDEREYKKCATQAILMATALPVSGLRIF